MLVISEINLKTITHLHQLYLCGMSLSKLSRNYCPSISRQRLHYFFKAYNLPVRGRPPSKKQKTYKGESYSHDKDGYWRKTSGNREYLHRKIWKEAGNTIPKGFAVIFKDRDKDNVKLSNLDCVSLTEFGEIYSTGQNQHTKRKSYEKN